MSGSNDKPTDLSGWVVGRGDRIAALSEYFVAHAGRFTPEALRKAAADVGFSAAEIDEAYGRATTRQRADELAQPLRSRARWVVLAAYVIVWLAFGAVYFVQPVLYNAGLFFQGVLTVALLIALVISRWWISGRRPDPGKAGRAMVVFLVVPVVLLIGVAGLCLPYTRIV